MTETKEKANINKAGVGSATAPPTCEKVIPIYPVRYAVMPYNQSKILYDTKNLDGNFPKFDDTSYCLRNLRDEGYVYIYDPIAREKWTCYQYNPDGVTGFYKLRINTKDGRLDRIENKIYNCIEHSIDCKKTKKIYMAYIDSPLTLSTMKNVESGDLKSKIMQEIDVGAWLKIVEAHNKATTKPLDKTPTVKHAVRMHDLISWNVDYRDDQIYKNGFNMLWSENPAANKLKMATILSAMRLHDSHGGMAVALYDAVGIASELSQLVNFEVNKIKANSEETARKEWVSNVIDKLTANAGAAAAKNVDVKHQQSRVKFLKETLRINGHKNPEKDRGIIKREEAISNIQEKARFESIKEYKAANKLGDRDAFIKDLPNIRAKIFKQIQAAGKPLLTWIEYTKDGNFTNALLAYDVKDNVGFLAYQGALARSIDGLIVTEKGADYLANLLTETGPTGILKQALIGHPAISQYVASEPKLEVIDVKASSMAFITKFIDDKLGTLSQLPVQPTSASRHLSLIVTTVLIQKGKFESFELFMQSKYRLILEVAEGNPIFKGSHALADLPQLMYKATTSVTNQFKFKPTTTTNQTIELYHLGKTDNPFVEVDLTPDQQIAKTKLNFWHNIKIGFSGLATALSAFNIAKSLEELKDKDKNVLITSLSLASNLLAGTSGTFQIRQAVFTKRAALTSNLDVKTAANNTALKAERIALGLAIVASMTAAINSVVKAKNSKSIPSTFLHLGAGTMHTTAAGVAFHQLLAKIPSTKAIAVKVTGKAAVVFGAKRAAYLLGPGFALTLLAIEAVAFLLSSLAEYFEKKKEIYWIEQSIWGIKPNPLWDTEKEKYELHKLFTKPKISLEPEISYSATRLDNREDVVVVLPGYQPQVSDVEIKKGGEFITKDWQGNDVKPIITDANGTRTIKYNKIKYWGTVSVKYWPNRFADPEMYYVDDTDSDFFNSSPLQDTKFMNELYRKNLIEKRNNAKKQVN